MYREITTKCWSIREVNKNLRDRKSLVDHTIRYLKKATAELATMLNDQNARSPGEIIQVTDGQGKTRSFTIDEVAVMLKDVKKIVELNLIDNIDRWAHEKIRPI
ncbi:MAG: hypothetical protein JW986_00690 [Methanotrichaceae archaeon]|nr:hypothetical protein [Methanotrichaceae archaeon]